MESEEVPRLVLKEGVEEWDVAVASSRSYFSGADVLCPDGNKYAVNFFEPIRLHQDVQSLALIDTPWIGEVGLVILENVTRETMEAAVAGLWKEGWFNHLKPIGEPLS